MDLGHVLLILAGVVGGGINALAGEGSRAGLTGRWRRIRAALPVCVAGATARCRAHMVAYHHVPTPGVDYLTMRGYWQLDLVSTNEKWVIRRWTIVRTAPWEGNPDLYRIAREGA
ncbi:hypothetical protein [Streptomyces sp. GMR22]|uniref:hypothetical protein n=1 Tax=Streptomyces sp. GMR22 TaxID=2759524 RepID=UPI0015F952A1|nr:hypothetical protein [Streptomyces sp. GMR22]MBA6434370.1 hypothetical protein [Streptomyces sp. GMR22]